MTIISGIEHGIETGVEDSGKAIETIKPGELVRPGESGAISPIEPIAPPKSTGTLQKAGLAVGGLGLAAGAFLPEILNSSAVTTGIQSAALAGTVQNIAGDATGLLNNAVSSITSSPVNMAITGVVAVGVLYLLFR